MHSEQLNNLGTLFMDLLIRHTTKNHPDAYTKTLISAGDLGVNLNCVLKMTPNAYSFDYDYGISRHSFAEEEYRCISIDGTTIDDLTRESFFNSLGSILDKGGVHTVNMMEVLIKKAIVAKL